MKRFTHNTTINHPETEPAWKQGGGGLTFGGGSSCSRPELSGGTAKVPANGGSRTAVMVPRPRSPGESSAVYSSRWVCSMDRLLCGLEFVAKVWPCPREQPSLEKVRGRPVGGSVGSCGHHGVGAGPERDRGRLCSEIRAGRLGMHPGVGTPARAVRLETLCFRELPGGSAG